LDPYLFFSSEGIAAFLGALWLIFFDPYFIFLIPNFYFLIPQKYQRRLKIKRLIVGDVFPLHLQKILNPLQVYGWKAPLRMVPF